MTAKPQDASKVSIHALFVILSATAIALLATPLAAPAMPEIARVFAELAVTEAFARGLLAAISFLPGEPNVAFLVKFILLSIPAAFIVLGAPVAGWICDVWSKKKLLTTSLIVFGIGGFSGYFADTFFELFLGRAVLGLAIAGIKTSTVAMVGDLYTGDMRNKVIGWQGSAMKLGGVFFMLLGGWLANFSWQTPFYGYLIAFLIVPSALLALSDYIPDSGTGPSAGSKAARPASPIPFLPSAFVFVSATLASTLFFVAPVQLPFYLRNVFDATPLQMGISIAVGNTAGALISLLFHQFKSRMNFVGIYAVIFLSMALGYFLVIASPSYPISLLGMIVAGIGFGLYVPNQSAWILSIVPADRRGFGVGIVTTAMFVGQFLSPFIIQIFTTPDDPGGVWFRIASALFVLFIVYSVVSIIISRQQGSRQ